MGRERTAILPKDERKKGCPPVLCPGRKGRKKKNRKVTWRSQETEKKKRREVYKTRRGVGNHLSMLEGRGRKALLSLPMYPKGKRKGKKGRGFAIADVKGKKKKQKKKKSEKEGGGPQPIPKKKKKKISTLVPTPEKKGEEKKENFANTSAEG